jgi:cysteine desulfurase family protein
MERIAYFDNAATTFPKPESVYVYTDRFYRECGVNVGRGQYSLSSKALSLVSETRELILELCHCPNKAVVFSHTATEALNTILQGLEWIDGMTVYVSPFEHNAVIRVLHYLSKTFRIKIETLSFDKQKFRYDTDLISEQFAKIKPNVVIVSHASNVCGVIAPIQEICGLSKAYKAINIIDMCQTMGLLDTDLSSENIDFAVFAGHKTLYAPFGVAGFICSRNINLIPLLYGGTGIDSANLEPPQSIPEKFEVGSLNIAAIAGLNASLHWIRETTIKTIYDTEQKNRDRILEVLRDFDNIHLLPQYGIDSSNSIGVISCVFDGYDSDNIGQVLSGKRIAVRTGLHCAPTAHKFLGTFPGGTVRFSVGYFNNDMDFKYLEESLIYIDANS